MSRVRKTQESSEARVVHGQTGPACAPVLGSKSGGINSWVLETRTDANVHLEQVAESARSDNLEAVAMAEPDSDGSGGLRPARNCGFERRIRRQLRTQITTLPFVNVGLVGHIPALARKDAVKPFCPVDKRGTRVKGLTTV